MGKKKSPPVNVDNINDVLTSLGITNWDALIVGDGSGTGWDKGCGWAAVLIDSQARERRVFAGGTNTGTVHIGEMMPCLHALLWYAKHNGRKLRKRVGRPVIVHVLTDSECVALVGRALEKREMSLDSVKQDSALWAAIMDFDRQGFTLRWHWIPRDSLALNIFCDAVSRDMRKGVEALPFPTGETGQPISIHDLNPSPARAQSRRQLAGVRHLDSF